MTTSNKLLRLEYVSTVLTICTQHMHASDCLTAMNNSLSHMSCCLDYQ